MNTEYIINKINNEFTDVYRASSKFKDSGELWNECINTIKNPDRMNKIIFCNDVLQIPPTKVFLETINNLNLNLTNQEKQYIGSFWGFVFKNIFGYRNQKEGVTINIKGVKKATYFYDKEKSIKVIDIEKEKYRVYKYKEFVNKDGINIDDDSNKNIRYLLTIPIDNTEDKSVLVILKNPSMATKEESDYTINKVLKFCHQNQYKIVRIMNLFPYYSTDPKGVKKFIENKSIYNDCIEKNLKILKENISISDDIIVAWGTDTINCKKEYNRIIELVENEIKDKNIYYVGRISTCGYPLHAQRWEDDMTKQVYKLI